MKLDPDRPRGILSPADRAFLLGEADMSHDQSKRNAAARVRERVRDGIEDFTFLAHGLDASDRRQVFEKSVDDQGFVDGLSAMLSFAYLGSKESGLTFDHLLEPAIRKSEEVYAAEVLGTTATVEVTLDVDVRYGTEVDDVSDVITAGDPVSPGELFSVAIANDPVLDDVDTITVQAGDDGPRDGEDFVRRIANYLDATVTDLPLNRYRLDISHRTSEGDGGSEDEFERPRT
jgi:hypothetical protein